MGNTDHTLSIHDIPETFRIDKNIAHNIGIIKSPIANLKSQITNP